MEWTDSIVDCSPPKNEKKKHGKLVKLVEAPGEGLVDRLENFDLNVIGGAWPGLGHMELVEEDQAGVFSSKCGLDDAWDELVRLMKSGPKKELASGGDGGESGSVPVREKKAKGSNGGGEKVASVALEPAAVVASTDHSRSKAPKKKKNTSGGKGGSNSKKMTTVEVEVEDDWVAGQRFQPEGMKVMKVPEGAKAGQLIQFNVQDGKLVIAPQAHPKKSGPNVLEVVVQAGWQRGQIVQVDDPRKRGRVFYCQVCFGGRPASGLQLSQRVLILLPSKRRFCQYFADVTATMFCKRFRQCSCCCQIPKGGLAAPKLCKPGRKFYYVVKAPTMKTGAW